LLWLPQTAAPLRRRLAILDTLRAREPAMAWDLLLSLLPQHLDLGHYTHAPRWRDWKPDRKHGVTEPEWFPAIAEIANRVLADAGNDSRRWSGVIAAIGRALKSRGYRTKAGTIMGLSEVLMARPNPQGKEACGGAACHSPDFLVLSYKVESKTNDTVP
jgi:hypothetical protein